MHHAQMYHMCSQGTKFSTHIYKSKLMSDDIGKWHIVNSTTVRHAFILLKCYICTAHMLRLQRDKGNGGYTSYVTNTTSLSMQIS